MDIFKQEQAYATTQEPITLAEAKAHILVDFSTDDTYIQALITQCRASLEAYCKISITPKIVTWTLDALPLNPDSYPSWISRWDLAFYGYSNCTKWIRMPWGPVNTITSVTQVTDAGVLTTLTLNTDYFVRGTAFKEIKVNSFSGTLIIVYTAQWPFSVTANQQIPTDLKLAILNEIAFRYTNRGEAVNRYAAQDVGISEGAQSAAKDYQQIWL